MNLEQMIIGDIINVKRKGPVGALIKLFTGSEYTHTACYIGKGKIIHSDWGGVKELPLSEIEDWDYDVFRVKEASTLDRHMAVGFMRSKVGAKYDYLGILGIAWNIIHKDDVNAIDMKHRYWCSELVADGYIHEGVEVGQCNHTYMVSPGDLSDPDYFIKVNEEKN